MIARAVAGRSTVSGITTSFSNVAHDDPQHMVSRLDATSHRTRHLRAAVAATAIVNRNLYDTIARTGSLHQHLDRPTKSHLTHLERLQHLAAHHAERTDIVHVRTIEQIDRSTREPVAQSRLWRDRAPLGIGADARAHHQIGLICQYRS